MFVTLDDQPLVLDYNQMQEHVFCELPERYRYIILAKGRRSGGTTGAIQYVLEQCIDASLNVLWVDTVQQNLIPLFQRFFMPFLRKLKPQFYNYRRQVHELDMFNSHIYFRSAERPQSLEGFFFDICVLNEAGIILKGMKGRELWYQSIAPMLLDRGGSCFMIGTPKGLRAKKNEDSDTALYYELFLKGQGGDSEWVSRCYDSFCNIEMLARQLIIGEANRGREITLEQARVQVTEDINRLAMSFPPHIRQQEIYGQFLDRTEEPIFHQHWFDIVDELPETRLHKQTIISLDTAFKIGELNDYSAGVVILQTTTGHYYIIDIINEKYEFPQLIQATKKLWQRHNDARYVLVEDKASGISLIQTLRQETQIPVKAVKVTKDKLTRASSTTPLFEQGKVHLLRAKWNQLYIDQMCAFNGLFDSDDDLVDASSQGFNFLNQGASRSSSPVTRRIIRTSSATQGY